jgi:hypothetical protein
MALGYEGRARLKVGSIEDVILCTSSSHPIAQQRLDSSCAYGGQIKTPVAETGIGYPHAYDFVLHDGSIEFELHKDFLDNQFKPWLLDRQKGAEIYVSTRRSAIQTYANSYWNSLSLSAAQGSYISGSIGFSAETGVVGSDGQGYSTNKTPAVGICDTSPPYVFSPPLNISTEFNQNPIPYWKTTTTMHNVLIPFITWNLNFSQDVVRFYTCESNSSPIAPKFIAVGPMTADFQADFAILDDASDFSVVDSNVPTLDIDIGGTTLGFQDLVTESREDLIAGQAELSTISVAYSIYKLVA